MSLVIDQLTKIYGIQKALDNVSFTVDPGEIVGFLGPNGAGKSTTMKIATGFLPPTEGTVQVGGYDVALHPLRVKRLIGYLPEHNPLYADMYVSEYLRFVGKLFALRSADLTRRINEVIDMCGLAPERHKKIESLSKGYRQRVGLAQALIHDPQVLILDEPTSGLDPNQLVEVRKLIKSISTHKTVIFSSHMLQEVQALCDRVVVISKGKIVANDTLNKLFEHIQPTTYLLTFESAVTPDRLAELPAVESAEAVSQTVVRIAAREGADIRREVLRWAADHNALLVSMQAEENNLEMVFKKLTN